ncbi:unnamed protein product, partial [Sphagnum balticum]
VVSVTDDGLVRVWHVHTGTCVYTLHAFADVGCDVAFDGKRIAVAGIDFCVRVYNAYTGTVTHTLNTGHMSRIVRIMFSDVHPLLLVTAAQLGYSMAAFYCAAHCWRPSTVTATCSCTTSLPVVVRIYSTMVRAAQLTDLVYKNGQAGIQKATVTITFANDDPAVSPVGYEDREEITVMRQTIANDIDPRLDELKKQTSDYNRFNAISRQIEILDKVWTAYCYVGNKVRIFLIGPTILPLQNLIDSGKTKLKDNKDTIDKLRVECNRLALENKDHDQQILALEEKMRDDTQLNELKEDLKRAGELHRKADTEASKAELALTSHRKAIVTDRRRIERDTATLAKKRDEYANKDTQLGGAQRERQHMEAEIERLEARHVAVSTGMDEAAGANAGGGRTWQESMIGRS